MKSIILGLLSAVTFAFPVQAQRQATHALLGPVRTVRTETANVFKEGDRYVEGPRVLSHTIYFEEDGRRPELCLYDAKGKLSRRVVLRFEGSKQVEFLNYDGAGKMWLRGVTRYDAAGRTREQATYNGDGSLRSKTTFVHDDLGQLVERAESDASGTVLEKSSNKYNDAGELSAVERSSYRPDGSLSFREFYSAAEKRVETVNYNKDGSLAGKSLRVNNDITEYAPDGSLKKSTFITSMGRLPEELTYNLNGTTRKESQLPDEIDAHGNWIKQTKWISDSLGTRPVKVTYRLLTYY